MKKLVNLILIGIFAISCAATGVKITREKAYSKNREYIKKYYGKDVENDKVGFFIKNGKMEFFSLIDEEIYHLILSPEGDLIKDEKYPAYDPIKSNEEMFISKNNEQLPFDKLDDGTLVSKDNFMTLYTSDDDYENESNCYGNCAHNWVPFIATSNYGINDHFTVITRRDGQKQWAYDGKPLYFWFADEKTGDKKGIHISSAWHTVTIK